MNSVRETMRCAGLFAAALALAACAGHGGVSGGPEPAGGTETLFGGDWMLGAESTAVAHDGSLYVLDDALGRICRFFPDGTSLVLALDAAEGRRWRPERLSVDAADYLTVKDRSGANRSRYDPAGFLVVSDEPSVASSAAGALRQGAGPMQRL